MVVNDCIVYYDFDNNKVSEVIDSNGNDFNFDVFNTSISLAGSNNTIFINQDISNIVTNSLIAEDSKFYFEETDEEVSSELTGTFEKCYFSGIEANFLSTKYLRCEIRTSMFDNSNDFKYPYYSFRGTKYISDNFMYQGANQVNLLSGEFQNLLDITRVPEQGDLYLTDGRIVSKSFINQYKNQVVGVFFTFDNINFVLYLEPILLRGSNFKVSTSPSSNLITYSSIQEAQAGTNSGLDNSLLMYNNDNYPLMSYLSSMIKLSPGISGLVLPSVSCSYSILKFLNENVDYYRVLDYKILNRLTDIILTSDFANPIYANRSFYLMNNPDEITARVLENSYISNQEMCCFVLGRLSL